MMQTYHENLRSLAIIVYRLGVDYESVFQSGLLLFINIHRLLVEINGRNEGEETNEC